MKKFFLSLFIAGLLWTCQSQSETPDYGVLTPVEFQKVVDSNKEIILLDVRTPAEFANGRIEGAVNVDIQSPGFLDEIRKLDKEGEYAVYCAVGRRLKVEGLAHATCNLQQVLNRRVGIGSSSLQRTWKNLRFT